MLDIQSSRNGGFLMIGQIKRDQYQSRTRNGWAVPQKIFAF
jgi:hypothetical protein